MMRQTEKRYPELRKDVAKAPMGAVKNDSGGIYNFVSFAVGERGACIWPELSKEVDDFLLHKVKALIRENKQHYKHIITTEPGGLQWARPLAKSLNLPLSVWRRDPSFINKERETVIGYHTVPYHARTMHFVDMKKLRKKRVLFVDDIISTGATINNIIGSLRENDVLIGDAVCILTKSPAFTEIERTNCIHIHSMLHVTDNRNITTRRKLEPKKPKIVYDCMLLRSTDGILIHDVLRSRTKKRIRDPDIYAGFMSGIQNILETTRPGYKKLSTTLIGNVLTKKGKHVALAVLLDTDADTRAIEKKMTETVSRIETRLGDTLPTWDGFPSSLKEAQYILQSFAYGYSPKH